MLKTIEIYWFNGLKNKVSFYNDTLDEANFMGSIDGNTPIKLSMDIREDAIPVIKQVSKDKILISSIALSNVIEETESESEVG